MPQGKICHGAWSPATANQTARSPLHVVLVRGGRPYFADRLLNSPCPLSTNHLSYNSPSTLNKTSSWLTRRLFPTPTSKLSPRARARLTPRKRWAWTRRASRRARTRSWVYDLHTHLLILYWLCLRVPRLTMVCTPTITPQATHVWMTTCARMTINCLHTDPFCS